MSWGSFLLWRSTCFRIINQGHAELPTLVHLFEGLSLVLRWNVLSWSKHLTGLPSNLIIHGVSHKLTIRLYLATFVRWHIWLWKYSRVYKKHVHNLPHLNIWQTNVKPKVNTRVSGLLSIQHALVTKIVNVLLKIFSLVYCSMC